MPTPRNIKDLTVVLGCFNYYRHFIPNFAQLASPLLKVKATVMSKYRVYYKNKTKTEKSDKPTMHWNEMAKQGFVWTAECNKAFKAIKERLGSSQTLAPANWSQPFVFYCDALYLGYGVALHQVPEGKTRRRINERPILFLSRILDSHEQNYAPTELKAGCVVWAIGKLSHYLDGANVEVVTDHSALQWLLKIKDVPSTRQNNRLLRWSLLLSQYRDKMTIIHRPGNSHGNVDGLSRLIAAVKDENTSAFPVDATPEFPDTTEWDKEYKKDVSLKLIHCKLSTGTYEESNVLKYHAFSLNPSTRRIYIQLKQGTRLVIPASMLKDVIVKTHEQYAHLGVAKTYDRISRHLWHPLLYRKCFDIVQDCASCCENNVLHHKPYGLAQPIESPAIPFDTVGIDFVTGLPKSGDEEFDSFATVTCKFTKVLRIIPNRVDNNAERFAEQFYEQVVRYHGLPRTIVSDRDKLFLSKFWSELLRLNGITRNLTSPYHPQADGQAEKSNQVVEIALRHCVDFVQQDWSRHLAQIEFAINTSRNATTGVSPYAALYGIKVRDAVASLVGNPSHVPTAEEFVANQIRIRDQMQGAIAWAQMRQALYYNEKHTLKQFKVGNKVMFNLKDFQITGVRGDKLGPRRVGPFTITERLGKLAYKLDLPSSYRMHNVFSIAKLEPATSNDLSHARPPMNVEEPEGEYFKVEKIIAQRYQKRKLKYLVKWKDYKTSSNSWEPASEIKRGAPDIVRQ